MEKKMETTIIHYTGYVGIVAKKMETSTGLVEQNGRLGAPARA